MRDGINKKAIVVDTNFIIEFKDDLQNIIEKLSKDHDVFVSEISINERISQKYLEMETIYNKINEAQKEFKLYATITISKPFDEKFNLERERTIATYNHFFCDKNIPLKTDNDTLNDVLTRVYRKTPPFSTAQGSSDKGFKDTLLWMSIIKYYKEHDTHTDIIFLTNDKGFTNNSSTLISEFFEETKKTIEIKTNDYKKTLLGEESEQLQSVQIAVRLLTEKEKKGIRLEIDEVFNGICSTEVVDWSGETYRDRNFEIYEEVDVNSIEKIMDNLEAFEEYPICRTQVS